MEAGIAIVLLLLIGLMLIFLEIFFIPGTTLAGALGGLSLFAGLISAYIVWGSETGHYLLAACSVLVIAALAIGFRMASSGNFGLTARLNQSHAGSVAALNLKAGDRGLVSSVLRPEGNAQFGDQRISVTSAGGFIEAGTEVEVVRIADNVIFVKSIKAT